MQPAVCAGTSDVPQAATNRSFCIPIVSTITLPSVGRWGYTYLSGVALGNPAIQSGAINPCASQN